MYSTRYDTCHFSIRQPFSVEFDNDFKNISPLYNYMECRAPELPRYAYAIPVLG